MNFMDAYRTRANKLKGTNYTEVHKKARQVYEKIRRRSKRKTYVRSAYFKKQKVFLDLFWGHLYEKKNFSDFMRRMKFYPCALEVIQLSHLEPISKQNPNKPSEIFHRFACITPEQEF